jgi:hypothetical protein
MANHSTFTLSNTTPTLLSPEGIHSGVELVIQNVSTNGYVYVGGPNVTSGSYGFRIDEESAFGMNVFPKESMYAIAENNGTVIATISSGLA